MLFNCNVSINEKGNLLIEVPTGITKEMNQKDVYERLMELMQTSNAFSKEYIQKDGVNKYVHFSSIQDRNGRYELITVGGVDFRIKMDAVLTSKEVEKHKPITKKLEKPKTNSSSVQMYTIDKLEVLKSKGLISEEVVKELILAGRVIL